MFANPHRLGKLGVVKGFMSEKYLDNAEEVLASSRHLSITPFVRVS
jgi:hypothetical protein